MATYFVATTGNDANSGTSASPWLTVAKAASAAGAGDTVTFNNGTYNFNNTGTWTGGAAGNPVVFQAATPGSARWQLNNVTNSLFLLSSDGYITFDGIKFTGCAVTGTTPNSFIDINNCSAITFQNCEAASFDANGFRVRGLSPSILFQSCSIHPENGASARTKDGINIIATTGTSVCIYDCHIYFTDHVGVGGVMGALVSASGNLVHDTGSHGWQTGDPAGGDPISASIWSCCFYQIGRWPPTYGPTDNKSALFHSVNASEVTFHHNIVAQCVGPGVAYRDNVAGSLYLLNNTFYDNDTNALDGGCAWRVYHTVASTPGAVICKNNLVHVGSAFLFAGWHDFTAPGASAPMTMANNLYYTTSGSEKVNWNSTTYNPYSAYQSAWEATAVIDTDPLLTSPGACNFTLQANSPAINAGVNVGYSFTGAAPDIGALEFAGGTIGVYMAAYARRRRSSLT